MRYNSHKSCTEKSGAGTLIGFFFFLIIKGERENFSLLNKLDTYNSFSILYICETNNEMMEEKKIFYHQILISFI